MTFSITYRRIDALSAAEWEAILALTERFTEGSRAVMERSIRAKQEVALVRSRDDGHLLGMSAMDTYPVKAARYGAAWDAARGVCRAGGKRLKPWIGEPSPAHLRIPTWPSTSRATRDTRRARCLAVLVPLHVANWRARPA